MLTAILILTILNTLFIANIDINVSNFINYWNRRFK